MKSSAGFEPKLLNFYRFIAAFSTWTVSLLFLWNRFGLNPNKNLFFANNAIELPNS